MEELWAAPSAEAADLIRSVSQQLLTETDGLAEALIGPALTAQKSDVLLADGSLANEDRNIGRSDLVQWLTANVHRPGRRVDLYFSPRTLAYVRDLASRHISPDFPAAWQVALALAWRRWLQVCLEQCTDPEVLLDALDVTAQSMVQYGV